MIIIYKLSAKFKILLIFQIEVKKEIYSLLKNVSYYAKQQGLDFIVYVSQKHDNDKPDQKTFNTQLPILGKSLLVNLILLFIWLDGLSAGLSFMDQLIRRFCEFKILDFVG